MWSTQLIYSVYFATCFGPHGPSSGLKTHRFFFIKSVCVRVRACACVCVCVQNVKGVNCCCCMPLWDFRMSVFLLCLTLYMYCFVFDLSNLFVINFYFFHVCIYTGLSFFFNFCSYIPSSLCTRHVKTPIMVLVVADHCNTSPPPPHLGLFEPFMLNQKSTAGLFVVFRFLYMAIF
jgi:hypothetical protein